MADYPSLPLWTDAYLADTRHLTTIQHGAYLLLMMEAWRRPTCSLPDDDALLSRLCGMTSDTWAENRAAVMAFWKLDNRSKTFVQKRLSKEKAYVKKRSKIQREKAAKGWEKRKRLDAAALSGDMPEDCLGDAPTPTPTPTPTPQKKEEVGAEAPSSRFEFDGHTIRLTPKDFGTWRKAYHAIPDLNAELVSLDAWFQKPEMEAKRKSWFQVTSGALNKKHQESLALKASVVGSIRPGGGTPLSSPC